MAKSNWWSREDDETVSPYNPKSWRSGRTSTAVDDDRDWFDDFEFDDEADDDRVGGLWGAYGGSSESSKMDRLVAAQRLVQGFVNTFATGDSRGYRVAFDASVRTAGTDFGAKVIVVSPAPLFDSTVTTDEANTVITAMAAHESSHVRYGRRTATAVKRAYPDDATAAKVSNLLDDVRIERRFAADYPGYATVFAPALAYVAKSSADADGAVDTANMGPTNLMVAAVRYADHVVWNDETAVERDWWTGWSDRWTATDSPRDHVAGVAEALDHLTERIEQEKEKARTCGPVVPGGNGTGGGESTGESTDEQPTGGSTGQTTTDVDPDADGMDLPVCLADEIAEIAAEHGARIDPVDAQQMVEDAKALVSDPETGRRGEVYWSRKGIASRRSTSVTPSSSAAAAIRAAFARYRTGHFSVEKGLRRGRLDSRSLSRIASNDHRLFAKRTAPSEGKYLVWLLVDCSGSMGGYPMEQSIAVSSALAAASRHLPTVRLDIWGWTTGLKRGATWSATRVWTTGEPISAVGYLDGIRMGGTPDREVLGWAISAIQKAAAPGERPMILMASDGAGSLQSPEIVEKARRNGVEVVSVALGWLDESHQSHVYGPRGYIPWSGSIAATAKPLGDLIGRATAAQ